MAIPNVPGVPPLASYAANTVELLFSDVLSALFGFAAPIWGVYSDGFPVIAADNQVDFEFKQDSPISTYPVEQGQFQTYDKVQMPAEIRCRFSAGGTEANRQEFLQSIEQVFNTIDLFDVASGSFSQSKAHFPPPPAAANPGGWKEAPPLPLPRSEMAWATAWNDRMHVLGGYAQGKVAQPYHHIFDPAKNAWNSANTFADNASRPALALNPKS